MFFLCACSFLCPLLTWELGVLWADFFAVNFRIGSHKMAPPLHLVYFLNVYRQSTSIQSPETVLLLEFSSNWSENVPQRLTLISNGNSASMTGSWFFKATYRRFFWILTLTSRDFNFGSRNGTLTSTLKKNVHEKYSLTHPCFRGALGTSHFASQIQNFNGFHIFYKIRIVVKFYFFMEYFYV